MNISFVFVSFFLNSGNMSCSVFALFFGMKLCQESASIARFLAFHKAQAVSRSLLNDLCVGQK